MTNSIAESWVKEPCDVVVSDRLCGVVACVTGATGLIGRELVELLWSEGAEVRVLSRQPLEESPRVIPFRGSLFDRSLLDRFMDGADWLFHCAGEHREAKSFKAVNIDGTKCVVDSLQNQRIGYFCHLSSAGVVGRTGQLWVDETSECHPQNPYESSKYEAERVVLGQERSGVTVLLRPTNVVSANRPGLVGAAQIGGWRAFLGALLKAKEAAHLVHARMVAEAAVHLSRMSFDRPEVFMVGLDEDATNTVSGVWSLVRSQCQDMRLPVPPVVPVMVPWLIRLMGGLRGNRGDVRYSSAKLRRQGVELSWDVMRIVRETLWKDREGAVPICPRHS